MMLQISLKAGDSPRNHNSPELAVAKAIARMKQPTNPHTTSAASRRKRMVKMLLCSSDRSYREARHMSQVTHVQV
jgi:hypothetical protein